MPNGRAIVFAMLVFLAKLAGGGLALRWPRSVPVLSALTGGVLLSAVFLHLLPEAVRGAGPANLPASGPIVAAAVGAVLFAVVDGTVARSRRASRSSPERQRGAAGAVGFVGHGWIEGATIGVGLQISTATGALAALTVAAHHLCEGLALVCYLLQRGRTPRRVRSWLAAAASAPLAGAVLGSVVPVPGRLVPLALGLFSGLFVFASLSALRYGSRGLVAHPGETADAERPPHGSGRADETTSRTRVRLVDQERPLAARARSVR